MKLSGDAFEMVVFFLRGRRDGGIELRAVDLVGSELSPLQAATPKWDAGSRDSLPRLEEWGSSEHHTWQVRGRPQKRMFGPERPLRTYIEIQAFKNKFPHLRKPSPRSYYVCEAFNSSENPFYFKSSIKLPKPDMCYTRTSSRALPTEPFRV